MTRFFFNSFHELALLSPCRFCYFFHMQESTAGWRETVDCDSAQLERSPFVCTSIGPAFLYRSCYIYRFLYTTLLNAIYSVQEYHSQNRQGQQWERIWQYIYSENYVYLWCCKCNKMFVRFRLPCARFFKVAVRVYNSNAIFRGSRDFWEVFYEHVFQGNLQFHHLSWGRYISASWHYYTQVDKVHT